MEKCTLIPYPDNKKLDSAVKLNNKILKNIQITSQENMIIKSLEKFYENNENVDIFLEIINLESIMSIRLIDYFVTKYSKNNKICYKMIDNNTENLSKNKSEQLFNVYSSYKQQLKAYQKKHFDPFSRGCRIPYFINDTCIITTIGQLNFFKWFISKNLFEYIINNQNIIENEMNHKNRIDKNIHKIKKNIHKIKKNKISLYNKNIPYICDNNCTNNRNVVVYFN